MSIINETMDQDRRLFAVVKRLVEETGWQHARGYALAFVLSALVAASTGAIAFVLEDVINDIFVKKNMAALIGVSVGVLVIFLVRGFSMFGQAVILNQISNAIVLELQVKLFRRVMSKEPSFVVGSSSGELMMIVGNGAKSATAMLNTLATAVGRDIFTIIALLVVLFIQNYALALGILLAIPIMAVVINQITKRVRTLSRQQLEVGALLSNRIRAGIQGIRVVKAFGIERELVVKMERNADDLRRLANKQAVVSNRLAPFTELIGGVIVAMAIAIGGWRVIEHGDTPGELVSFIFAALMIYDPARRLSQARTTLEQNLVGIRLMYDFLDLEDVDQDSSNAKALIPKHGEIVFDKVTFSYDRDRSVLNGISFTIEGGRTTAIVGRSGSGKTTISNLVLRFWRPTSGSISIDNQNINDITSESLRANIAYVGQEAFLFDGTLRDNILVGNPSATEKQVMDAIKAANAYDFIQSAPKGLDTVVGELGNTLSGGQRQRIAIARALLRNAQIVLLDEPTSALDGQTERDIQSALKRLSIGRTTIIIAHRLSTIRDADKIIVIGDGQIVESGKHETLLAQNGSYARLYVESETGAQMTVDNQPQEIPAT